MIDRLRGKLRRLRTRLAMQAALRNRFLWRLFSRGFRQAWSQRADGWDHMVAANAHTWFLPLDAALSTLPERWSPTQAVDVGGGTGRAGFHVAARYPEARVVVIDLAPGMVAFGHAPHSPCHLRQTDPGSQAGFRGFESHHPLFFLPENREFQSASARPRGSDGHAAIRPDPRLPQFHQRICFRSI
jgi:SAM-dependent methyltransferase